MNEKFSIQQKNPSSRKSISTRMDKTTYNKMLDISKKKKCSLNEVANQAINYALDNYITEEKMIKKEKFSIQSKKAYDHTMTVRMSVATFNKIKDIAEIKKNSLNDVMKSAIEYALDNYEEEVWDGNQLIRPK